MTTMNISDFSSQATSPKPTLTPEQQAGGYQYIWNPGWGGTTPGWVTGRASGYSTTMRGGLFSSIGDAIGSGVDTATNVVGDAINTVGDIPLYPGAPSVNQILEDPTDINTYSDPQVQMWRDIDEATGSNLFGEIEYNNNPTRYADFNTDPSVLQYYNPDAARVQAERDFINQRRANFNLSPNDPKTASSMGLWDYYNSIGDSDSANATAFKTARDEFNAQYNPQAYNDWGGLTDYERDFGRINSVAQREGSPYLYDVATANGNYVYVPRDLLGTGLLGDQIARQLPDSVDENGNVIPGGLGPDMEGLSAIYGTGVDLSQGKQVILDPSKLGGLNQIALNGEDYKVLNQTGLNQGFMFTPEQIANLKLNLGQGTNTMMTPSVEEGLAGPLGEALKIGGTLAAPFTAGASLGLVSLGAGMSSLQNQITADQLRAAGYDVDSSALHRGHAMNAAQAGFAALSPSLDSYWKSLGISDPALIAGATGMARGAVTGAIADPEHPWQGAGNEAMVQGLTSYGAKFLNDNPNPSQMDQFTSGQLAGQFGNYLRGNMDYYKELNNRMNGIDPNADLSTPQGFASALGGMQPSAVSTDGYTPTAAEMADYYPQAEEFAQLYNPRLGDMYNAATAKGFGLEGLSSYDDAMSQETANRLALGEQYAQALRAQDQAKRGLFGAGGAGGVGGLGMVGMGSMGMGRAFG